MNKPGTAKLPTYNPASPSLSSYPFRLRADDCPLPELEASLETIGEHQRRLWARGEKALLLIIQGPDTSGKDSLIRTLARYAEPVGFHAWSFRRPNHDEARHDFLWRAVRYLPAYGEMVAFNRSYYEAVMAERIWPVLSPDRYDWPGRFRSIRDFEGHLIREGTRIIKVWLNLSEEEHRKRLLKRLDTPRKRWKFDAKDIKAWEKRRQYLNTAEEALAATHSDEAPWLIVPADDKKEARHLVAAILADALRDLAPSYPVEDRKVLERYRRLLRKP